MVVIAFLSTHMTYALLAFGASVLADIVLGILEDVKNGKPVQLAKFKDFIITSVGWQYTAAFGGALLLMIQSNQPMTETGVASMAVLYTLKMISDIIVKLGALVPSKPAPAA